MKVEEIRKKVRSLCEDAGLQFFFAVPNASEWAVTDCEHLRKIVSYHKELETLPLATPTQKEKQINAQVIDIRRNLHDIMKDIESKELYNKLSDLDRQIYKIREIVKGEDNYEVL